MNPELEAYRKQAIATLKQNAAFIRDTARDVLMLPAREVYVVGSVLDRSQFSEDSDIDVAVVVDGPKADTGLSEPLSQKLQDEMLRYPLDDIGVVNTLVFVNKLTLARGKWLKVAVAE
jgi:predicted nucleotidyltransferase